MIGRAAACATLLLLSLSADLAGAPKWTRVRTPGFTLVGQVGEGQLRQVAKRFEQFREVFGRLFPATRKPLPSPVVIAVFGSERAYAPFMPVYDGRRVDVRGLFLKEPGIAYISMNLGGSDEAYKVVFHEYTHLLVEHSLAQVPLWFNEGLAEYYATLAMRGDREAMVGKVHEPHVFELRERFIPLAELMAVTSESPLYNEGSRRSIFYAESWALVHYLLNGGRPERRAQLTAYLQRFAEGLPPARAFREAFGGDEQELERELRRYVQQSVYQSYIYRFTDRFSIDEPWTAEPLAAADAEATLGDLLLAMGRDADAAARLEANLETAPGHARTLAMLARARHRQGRDADADTLFDRSIALAGADYVPYYYRAATLLRAERPGTAVAMDRAVAARAAGLLEKVVALQPQLADAQMLLGLARLHLNDPAGALAPLNEAYALSPRHEYALLVAQAQLAARDLARARPLLASLAERGSSAGIRETAERLLALARDLERAPAGATGRGPGLVWAVGPPGAEARPSNAIPVLRTVRAGETREEGLLEAIDCVATGVRIQVRLPGRTLRLTAARLEDIEFISYRRDLTGAVECGPRVPMGVHVTYRPAVDRSAGDAAGTAVALEFLPPK